MRPPSPRPRGPAGPKALLLVLAVAIPLLATEVVGRATHRKKKHHQLDVRQGAKGKKKRKKMLRDSPAVDYYSVVDKQRVDPPRFHSGKQEEEDLPNGKQQPPKDEEKSVPRAAGKQEEKPPGENFMRTSLFFFVDQNS